MKLIRSTKHTTKFMNKQKSISLCLFIKEYRRMLKLILDDIWDTIDHTKQTPKHMDYKPYSDKSWLSARILRTLTDQLLTRIKSIDSKYQKRLFIYNKQIKEGIKPNKTLLRKIKDHKPNLSVDKINPILNSINYDTKNSSNEFDEFLRLKCIGNKQQIKIPIKYHRQYNKLNSKAKRISGIEINEKFIKINFELPKVESKTSGCTHGADQGINTVLTVSDNQTTPLVDKHEHSLKSILSKLSNKKKGSKAFKRAQDHRTNFVNWSINQIDFTNIKELRLEKISKLNYKKRTNRYNSHWTHSLIKKKIKSVCATSGVRFVEQPSFYRSQRCSSCGIVCKANRKKKQYSCDSCGFKVDSDLNAALNHKANLPSIGFIGSKLKKDGFYWLESGFYDLDHKELTVPCTKEAS